MEKWIINTFDSIQKDKIHKKLERFSNFKKGWSIVDGDPIGTDVIQQVNKIYSRYKYYMKDIENDIDVFPGVDGSVIISFYYYDKCLEVEVEPDLNINTSIEQGFGANINIIEEDYGIKEESIENKILKIIWMDQGYTLSRSRGFTMTQEWVKSAVEHLKILPQEEEEKEYLSSTRIVSQD